MLHTANEDTIAAVLGLKEETGAKWREMPRAITWRSHGKIKVPDDRWSTVYNLAKGRSVDVDFENDIRLALGLSPVTAMSRYECPTCGGIHSLDTNGRPLDCKGLIVKARLLKPARQKGGEAEPPYRPRLRPKYRTWSGAQIEKMLDYLEEQGVEI